MSSKTVLADAGGSWRPISALLAKDGSQTMTALQRLSGARAPLRDVADALHCLCLLHGSRPGLVDIARERAVSPVARAWLDQAAEGFAPERDWLTRLVAAAGPIPSTANQVASESAIAAQRHALETLAKSDRPGCALGAAAALVMDWWRIREWLDRVADRLSLPTPPCELPELEESRAVLLATPITPAQARAFQFGAQQMLAQQRGLWALIDARAESRTTA